MKVGLIDCDSHNFPNLPWMKISAYHKKLGDDVGFANAEGVYDLPAYAAMVWEGMDCKTLSPV